MQRLTWDDIWSLATKHDYEQSVREYSDGAGLVSRGDHVGATRVGRRRNQLVKLGSEGVDEPLPRQRPTNSPRQIVAGSVVSCDRCSWKSCSRMRWRRTNATASMCLEAADPDTCIDSYATRAR